MVETNERRVPSVEIFFKDNKPYKIRLNKYVEYNLIRNNDYDNDHTLFEYESENIERNQIYYHKFYYSVKANCLLCRNLFSMNSCKIRKNKRLIYE